MGFSRGRSVDVPVADFLGRGDLVEDRLTELALFGGHMGVGYGVVDFGLRGVGDSPLAGPGRLGVGAQVGILDQDEDCPQRGPAKRRRVQRVAERDQFVLCVRQGVCS